MPELRRVVFAIYPDVTHLDFAGPWEVLARIPGFEAVAASEHGGSVRSDTGLEVSGVRRLADIDQCDVLCVPGGPGTADAMLSLAFLAEIARLSASASYVASVCTGSLLLGAAGLLRGKRAACHWAWRELLELFGATPDEARVVRDGNVLTGGGVTAGIDFALTLAEELRDRRTAEAIQLMIEYAPAPPFSAGRPETAPPEVVAEIRARLAGVAAARRAAAEASPGAVVSNLAVT
jgi:transcriptional regulator GlxA family with amidase domain